MSSPKFCYESPAVLTNIIIWLTRCMQGKIFNRWHFEILFLFFPDLIESGFNDTSILVDHFVSSPREREKRDRRDSWWDELEFQKSDLSPALKCQPFDMKKETRGPRAMSRSPEWHIGLDKGGYPVNIFLISPQKHMLWVLIRSASARRF